MLKKTITYTNFNDETVSEDFYFHLSKSEIAELHISFSSEGIASYMERIMRDNDRPAILAMFRNLVMKSVGRRSADGARFTKNDEIRDAFTDSGAFDAFYMELLESTDAAIAFFKGVVPTELSEKIDVEELKSIETAPDLSSFVSDYTTATTSSNSTVIQSSMPKQEVKKYEEYTQEELLAMPQEQFDQIVGTNAEAMTKQQLVLAMRRKIDAKK